MRKFFFRVCMLALMCAVGIPAHATSPTAYGILLFDQQKTVNRIVSFPFPSMTSFVEVRDFGSQYISAGVYYDGYYYAASNGYATITVQAEELLRIDLETGESTSVGALEGFSNKIADMTIDYSTGKCYAISGQMGGEGAPGSSALYTIDLATASAVKVTDLGNFYFTLACSYGGQLYGITKYGNLAAIDKVTGRETIIGETGLQPNTDNSMEFDHTDKTLWWAANTLEGDGYLCKVNIETGLAQIISTMGAQGDASIAGLYVPFTASADGTPQAVENLSVTPDPAGACRAELQWVNPTIAFGGGTLEQIQSVNVWRNDELVAQLTGMQPGKAASWTDEISGETGLLATYEVAAVNEVGRGVVTDTTVFVGEDVPGVPASVTITKVHPNEAVITWSAPATGANGGWYDRSTLTYDVVRQPNGLTIGEDLAEPTCTDAGIKDVATYTYQITATTRAGEGGTATSDETVLGPGNKLPYSCSFANAAEVATWTVVDADGDGRTWEQGYLYGSMQYNNNVVMSSTPSDDWLISHDFELEAGKNYKGTFSARASNNQKLLVMLGQGNKAEDMTIKELYKNEALQASEYTTYEYSFTVDENGIYNIGFYTYSNARAGFFYLTGITLEEVADNNLTMLGLTGPKNAVAGSSYTYRAEISNKGANVADAFQVLLKDGQGATLATASVDEPLETGATRTVEMAWTPETEGTVTVHAEVVYAKDEIPGDNASEEIEVEVLPAGSADFIEIGSDVAGYNRYYLFDVYNSNAAALNIYTPGEIGKVDGVVESFNFVVDNSMDADRTGIPVKVYMANTDMVQATTWIPESDMTLVYEGTLDIPAGTNEIKLELQKKFYFEQGKNLAILTVNDFPDRTYYSGITYPYYKTTEPGGTYYWGSSYTEFSFNTTTANYGNTSFGNKASVTLQMRCAGANISGTVTDGEGQPLAGAEVTIVERNITVMTDADGNYELKYVPDGDYTVTVTKQDYATVTREVSIANGANVTLDVDMVELHSYNVSGIVSTLDGKPLAGAAVSLTGYEDYATTTGDDGAFAFETVYASAEAYKLSVGKEWFATQVADVAVVDADVEIDSIKLEYLQYAPVNVSAAEGDGGNVAVAWQAASSATTLRTDGGTLNGNLGISNGNEYTVIGTIYREPMALTSVSWYQTLAGGPHYYINVFVLALDAEGNPTSEVLYTEQVPAVDDQWNNYTLPDTVFAPNGCVVGLSYFNGYLGVGIDGGKDLSYPFREKTHVFAATYTNGEFDFIEDSGIRSNLMIRADGYRLADNGGKESLLAEGTAMPDFCSYQVWRVKSGDEANEAAWVSVDASEAANMTAADNLAGVQAGMYAYAVKTVYPDGTMSQATFSPLVAHNMYSSVVVNVKSNSEGEGATGAVVTLNGNTYAANYTAVVDGTGAAVFDNLIKDTYRLTISLAGYEGIDTTVDFTSDDSYNTDPYLLKEVIVAPENLKVELVNGSTSSVLFSWNTTDPIEEGFESCEDFEINPAGVVDWTYIDGDGLYTYGFGNASFANMTEQMAYIAFNPSAVSPAQTDNQYLLPHAGAKFLASFVGANYTEDGQNDDWFISPELTFAGDFGFSFYAKSYFEGQDKFSVGYAIESDPATDDFVWLAENVAASRQDWVEYSYTIPAAAKHVAIRNVSTEQEGFILMIDDVKIGPMPAVARLRSASAVQMPAVAYEVFLDGQSMGETSEISWPFDNLAAGEHTAGVKSVYNSGESEMMTITFDTRTLGIDDVQGDMVNVYPNPVSDRLTVEGEYTRLLFTNMGGATVMMLDGKQLTVDVSSLPAGMYILTIIDDNAGTRATRKVTVVR